MSDSLRGCWRQVCAERRTHRPHRHVALLAVMVDEGNDSCRITVVLALHPLRGTMRPAIGTFVGFLLTEVFRGRVDWSRSPRDSPLVLPLSRPGRNDHRGPQCPLTMMFCPARAEPNSIRVLSSQAQPPDLAARRLRAGPFRLAERRRPPYPGGGCRRARRALTRRANGGGKALSDTCISKVPLR